MLAGVHRMNNSRIRKLLSAISLMTLCVAVMSCSKPKSPPPLRDDGTRWRIAYAEGGEWFNYDEYFYSLMMGLVDLGYFPNGTGLSPTVDDYMPARDAWKILSETQPSPYLEFLPDGYYTAEWQEDKRKALKTLLTKRLQNNEIDLLIAMGTWSGLDFATTSHSVPTFVLSASDPLPAGIVKGKEFSGIPHVFAKHDPDRFLRQIRTFHRIIKFKTIGVAFENSPEGRSWSNVNALEQVAEELDFKVVEAYVRDTDTTDEKRIEDIKKAYSTLALEVDALWIGASTSESPENMPEILEPLIQHKVKTWSQMGEAHVKRGVLMSVAPSDRFQSQAFIAEAFDKIIRGTPPGKINQIYETPKSIIINAETARRIDYTIPPGLLKIADRVYDTIEGETPETAAE